MTLSIWDNNSNVDNLLTIKDYLCHVSMKDIIDVNFIENEDNSGVYTSRDELLKRVNPQTQFILSIDDDIILPSEILSSLLALFKQDRSFGIIGPRTVFDEYPYETAHGAGFINWWIGSYSDLDSKTTMECDYVIGCCMLIKRSVVDDLGGFDRDYYTSHGEIDFCIKAKNMGYKILYCPDVAVRHRVAKGGTKTLERIYYLYRNKLFVIKKNFPIPQKWISLTLYSFFGLFKSVFESIYRNRVFSPQEINIIIKAFIDGWLNRAGKRV